MTASNLSENGPPPAAPRGQEAALYFEPAVRTKMAAEIARSGGNEVFFQAQPGPDGRVTDIRVLSRGDRNMTPAMLSPLRPGQIVIHNHPGGNLTPSEADLRVASLLGSDKIAFLIVDNQVTRFYAVVEPFVDESKAPLPESLVSRYFSEQGELAGKLTGFEYRQDQDNMARLVLAAFNRERYLLAEAGTGVGKSLAYLIPAALWSLHQGQRVVVSTNTINLQEQLINKDLPLLTEKLGLKIKAVLVKGRGNYLCRRRVAELADDIQTAPADFDDEIKALVSWALSPLAATRSDYPGLPSAAAWELVASDSDLCPSARCAGFADCFYFKARRQAAEAQLLIVNHHLLMADLQFESGSGVLPEYQALVMDEVHHLEEVATGYLGEGVSEIGLVMLLNRLAHRQRRQLGLLRRLRRALARDDGAEKAKDKGRRADLKNELLALLDGDAEPAVLLLAAASKEYFASWSEILLNQLIERENVIDGNYKLRVTARELAHPVWRQELAAGVGDFVEDADRVLDALGLLALNLEKGLESRLLAEAVFSPLAIELNSLVLRLRSQVDFIGTFLRQRQSDPAAIAWIENNGRRANFKLVLAPLEVGPQLQEKLYARIKTLIMVSATIAIGGGFDFFINRVGLRTEVSGQELARAIFPGPFDYRRHARIFVPADLPLPGTGDYLASLALFLDTLITRIGGRTLVLFTSYRAMREVAAACRDSLARRGVRLLLQGEGQRQWLLGQLQQDFSTALFATDSFWEGVDVRGRALECLVVARLPFRVPSDPVTAARLEFIAAAGGNPFYDYSLPQAALKLKQGVGRLIRSRQDRGIIVIADRRLIEKRYGSRLRAVLPPAPLATLSCGEIVTKGSAFLS